MDQEHQQEKLSTLYAESQVSMPSEEQLKVITKWVGIFMEHHHKEVSELGMVAYIEGLKDLGIEQIERGCERALKEVDHMPTVAHIRERTKEFALEALFSPQESPIKVCAKCSPDGWVVLGGRARRCKHQ